MIHSGGTYLEGCHRKGVNVALFRGVADDIPSKLLQKKLWGHIPKSSQLMVVGHDASERAHDPKVSETRLTVPGDQDVALDTATVNARFY